MSRVALPQAQNLCLQSDDIGASTWIVGSGVTVTNNTTEVTDPIGGNAATKLVYDGTQVADTYLFAQAVLPNSQERQVCTAGVRLRTASGTQMLQLTDNMSGAYTQFTVTSSWQLFQMTAPNIATGYLTLSVFLWGAPPAFTFYAWGAQVTQANRLGPYVKTGGAPVLGPIRNARS